MSLYRKLFHLQSTWGSVPAAGSGCNQANSHFLCKTATRRLSLKDSLCFNNNNRRLFLLGVLCVWAHLVPSSCIELFTRFSALSHYHLYRDKTSSYDEGITAAAVASGDILLLGHRTRSTEASEAIWRRLLPERGAETALKDNGDALLLNETRLLLLHLTDPHRGFFFFLSF